jgi:hypothetical protein
MDTQQQVKYRTITLTGRPPVKIREDQWLTVAEGEAEQYDGENKRQSGRATDVFLRVRQHQDGRTLIYGGYDYSTRWQGERDSAYRVGRIITVEGVTATEIGDAQAIVDGIREVGAELMDKTGGYTPLVQEAIDACIADMPAEEV